MDKTQKEILRSLINVEDTAWMDIPEREGVNEEDSPHLVAAKAILNLRKIEDVIKARVASHKKVVDKYMANRKTPYQKGHIRIAWDSPPKGYDVEKAEEACPETVAAIMNIKTQLTNKYPLIVTYDENLARREDLISVKKIESLEAELQEYFPNQPKVYRIRHVKDFVP